MTFDFLVIMVILNMMATITLWRTAARKPAKLKKKFVSALLSSEPIVPNHRPPVIGEGFLSKAERQFFIDFEDFADVVNWWLADEHVGTRWRLQVLPDTDRKHGFSDMPQFGRRYDVFHNQVNVGTLEVCPGVGYSAAKPDVYTSIQLEWVRLLSIQTTRDFLYGIASHVCEFYPMTEEYVKARADIEGCLTTTLWKAQEISFDLDDQGYGELELQLNGSALWYFERREAPSFKK